MYDFLLVRHCNYSSILYHFRVIWHWIISWQWRIQNFIIRGPPRIIKFWPAPSLNFYLKKVGFGAFWYDFLRSERHKKRHIRPAVLILYHSCIRQLSLKGRAQHLLTVLLVEYESYAKIAMVIGGGGDHVRPWIWANASRGVLISSPAFAGTRCTYPQRDGQAEYGWLCTDMVHLS